MTKKTLDIHLEDVYDRGEKLKEILRLDIPVAISICPETLRLNGRYKDRISYSPEFLDLIRRIVSREGSILGQQGNTHECKYKHQRFIDPYHENFCLYNTPLSAQEQRYFMEHGRETLRRAFRVEPQMYVPPNHQFDETTLQVSNEMGFGFFAMKGIKTKIPLLFANLKGISIVLPEVKLDRRGHFVYAHYNEIRVEDFEKLAGDIYPIIDTVDNFSMREKYFGPDGDRHLDQDLAIIQRNIEATNRRKSIRDLMITLTRRKI